MRITDIRERPVEISRYDDPAIPPGGLTTSIVAVVTDVVQDGEPVIGFGFSSIGRFAQSGLIRERFAPRLLAATDAALAADDGRNLDPFRAWNVMMTGEKPGGHGERSVSVGTLDMAVWDAAAKIAGVPLHRFLRSVRGIETPGAGTVRVYGGGGYYYPHDDVRRLGDEARRMLERGYTHVKIKIGARSIEEDLARIEAVAGVVGGADRVAVDAMNAYDPAASIAAADALASYRLWW